MALTKAVRFSSLRAFVAGRWGEDAWEALLATLPDEEVALIRTSVASDWLDLTLRARLVRALCERPEGLANARALGRFDADSDFGKDQRWFLRLMPPALAIRNMNLYWRRFEDTGTWHSAQRGVEIEATLRDWDPVEAELCETLRSYLVRTMELLGGGEVTLDHTACVARGSPSCVFRTRRFVPPDRVRWAKDTLSPADLPAIARELDELTRLEDVASAILTVLHVGFSMSYVALRVNLDANGARQAVSETGERQGGPTRRVVLPSGGIKAGVLDVEGPGSAAEVELLDAIVPSFANALRRACRVAAAATRWNLSEQQQRVLERMVQGKRAKEIASELGIGVKRVEAIVNVLKQKAGAKTPGELTALAQGEA